MKFIAIIWAVLLLTSCASSPQLTASQCQAQYDALQSTAKQAWSDVDRSDKDAIAKATEVAADSARKAADLSIGPCKKYDQSKPGEPLQI